MNINTIQYMGIKRVIERNTAEILEDSHDGIFVRDLVSGAYMLATESLEVGKQWLNKHKERDYKLLNLFSEELCLFAKAEYGLQNMLDCYQAAYLGKGIDNTGLLQLTRVKGSEVQDIMRYYDMISEDEMRTVIERGNLYWGMVNDVKVGFVGEHLEGSLGILYVIPEYRKNGYGFELEKSMINLTIESGFTPFGQIEIDNEKSIALQKKIGLEFSDDHVYWLF